MNKVLLVGRIATDPTNRATSSNVQVSNFSVACNGSFSKANQQNNTVFVIINLTAALSGLYFFEVTVRWK